MHHIVVVSIWESTVEQRQSAQGGKNKVKHAYLEPFILLLHLNKMQTVTHINDDFLGISYFSHLFGKTEIFCSVNKHRLKSAANVKVKQNEEQRFSLRE